MSSKQTITTGQIMDLVNHSVTFEDGSRRSLLYLAPHKIEQWWEQAVGSISSFVLSKKKSQTTTVTARAQLKWGTVLSFFGFPEAAGGIEASHQFGKKTGEESHSNLTSHVKALVIERYCRMNQLLEREWHSLRIWHRLFWEGTATLAVASENTGQSMTIPGVGFRYKLGPNILPDAFRTDEFLYYLESRIGDYEVPKVGVGWIQTGVSRAVMLMNLEYTKDLALRYSALPKHEIVLLGEAMEWVGDIRFLNPFCVWLRQEKAPW